MADARRKILCACENGDVPSLETLFQELNIGPDHPPCDIQQDENDPLPSVQLMYSYACLGQQLEALRFLCAKFPDVGFYSGPLTVAIDSGNAELLRFLCTQRPGTEIGEIGEDSNILALGYAASKGHNELVKVLLEAGADPNEPPPYKLPGSWTLDAALIGNLPKSTFELFYDAGYNGCENIWAPRFAVEKGRPDVLEVMFRRGRRLPFADFPPEEELIEVANEMKDPEMAAFIRRLYAKYFPREKGLISKIMGKFRFSR
ncbi:hypothetical protein DM02DRAFT_217770 [Periconia macrospinosa]|uniref:Uncharacterized protein n=1 Tax=Periconia macrospinosa TaxID=97972 RepID=A0A2V1DZN7_9PLEO|nr:hypothetical protein DM02DRAFT_217770 [Periconia macrospinosa]